MNTIIANACSIITEVATHLFVFFNSSISKTSTRVAPSSLACLHYKLEKTITVALNMVFGELEKVIGTTGTCMSFPPVLSLQL